MRVLYIYMSLLGLLCEMLPLFFFFQREHAIISLDINNVNEVPGKLLYKKRQITD